MKKLMLAIVLSCLTNLFNSCRIIPSLTCNPSINKDYIQSSCGLTNGVRFEQLEVLKLDSNNLPLAYRVIRSFECYNPGVNGTQEYWPEKIYFGKPNGHYLWNVDTATNGLYIVNRPWRDKIKDSLYSLDSVIKQKQLDGQETINKYDMKMEVKVDQGIIKSQSICPEKFVANTWYFLNFYDQRYEAYLYIDKELKFKIYKIDLPTNI